LHLVIYAISPCVESATQAVISVA